MVLRSLPALGRHDVADGVHGGSAPSPSAGLPAVLRSPIQLGAQRISAHLEEVLAIVGTEVKLFGHVGFFGCQALRGVGGSGRALHP